MRIVILGSGGAVPTTRRMLPSTVLLREGEMFIFDCGEGTQLQLTKSRLGWARLRAIFISHLHGDHIIGLPGLLMTMNMGSRKTPLKIFGPPGISDYIRLNQKILRFGVGFPLEVEEIEGGLVVEEEEYRIEALPVKHRVFTLAYRLVEKPRPGRFNLEKARELGIPPGPLYKRIQSGEEINLDDGRLIRPEEILGDPRPGRKVVYMVDTRPFPGEVEFVRRADLLIHDGMFDDEMEGESRVRGHSTTRQAATVARDAGVDRLVLVHISPRYLSIREMLRQAREVFPHTRIARDLDVYEVPLKEVESA
ncbi:MAG: ribonuclease Z [Candidatus Auribacterota bacterium]|nr:ribonuclease Z [Candidatus Auribacterota bacterium]